MRPLFVRPQPKLYRVAAGSVDNDVIMDHGLCRFGILVLWGRFGSLWGRFGGAFSRSPIVRDSR